MAARRQPLSAFLPGVFAALFILSVLSAALIALWQFAWQDMASASLTSPTLWRVFAFTVYQAGLSALLSVVLGLIVAKACHPLQFAGKTWLLRLFAITFVLPALVLIVGLPVIYGRQGIIATLLAFLGWEYGFSIYGLTGILLAHLFYNMPFAFRLFYQSLDSVAAEHRQLAAQLGLSYFQQLRYLEWPVLSRQVWPTFALIFMLCFTSFAIVLTLGGGPQNASFEVAIYQALRDFELSRAVILSLVQLVFCFGFMFLLRRLSPQLVPESEYSPRRYLPTLSQGMQRLSYLVVFIAALFVLSPLVAVVINGLYGFSFAQLTPGLGRAVLTSLSIAVGSGLLAVLLALLLLSSANQLQLAGYRKWADQLVLIGSLILAIPGMVLASGFFLLLFEWQDSRWVLASLIMVSNGLMALPFALKTLENPLRDVTERYHFLALSLNLQGMWRFYWIELKALQRLLCFAFAFAAIISLGDFGIIALFGHQDFATLPFYLYQQLGSYRNQDAAFTALVLLLLCFVLFTLIEFLAKKYDQTK